jgi:serine/threonine protein kinase
MKKQKLKKDQALCLFTACSIFFSRLNASQSFYYPLSFPVLQKNHDEEIPTYASQFTQEFTSKSSTEHFKPSKPNTSQSFYSPLFFPILQKNHDEEIPTYASQFTQKLSSEFFPEIPITIGKKLAQGGYGTIYESYSGEKSFIVKEVREDKGDKGERSIKNELKNSQNFWELASEKFLPNPHYAQLLAMDLVIPVIGSTINGSLVQRRVVGENLFKIVSRKQAPYRRGYPDDLQTAILCAWSFFAGLSILHYLGFVHCDIKPGNVMIDSLKFLCHIIDLGAMKKIGKTIQIHSNNGAPEFIEQTCVIKDDNLEKKKLQDERKVIAEKLRQSRDMEAIKRLEKREKEIDARLKAIEGEIQLAKSKRDAVAKPSYDIYSSAPIFLAILFGKSGYQFGRYLYFRQEKDAVQFHYLELARRPKFNAYQYFLGKLSELNGMMRCATGQNYSRPMLECFAGILARISSLDHRERPHATEIAKELRNIYASLEGRKIFDS